MDSEKLTKITNELKEKFPDLGLQKIEIDESSGKSSFYVQPSQKTLASLPPEKAMKLRGPSYGSVINRNVLDRSYLDLSITTSPSELDPKEAFRRSIKYYYEADIYGSHIDILTNLSCKGFENDIDDDQIKMFYDTWNFDVGFDKLLYWIFFDLFRVGMVRTYKIIGKYEPGVTYMSPVPGAKKARGDLKKMVERADRIHRIRLEYLEKELKGLDARKKLDKLTKLELSAKKRVWSKGYMPISYTILNPLLVNIEGSLLFDKSTTTLTPSDELKKLVKKASGALTEDEKEILKLLPSEFKTAVEKGGNIPLDPMFVGGVDYKKQPYERYPRPRGIKVFDAIEYKKSLREADLSTLDGITNYILKITIGNDAFPVVDQNQLNVIADLFNTSSKSFDIVWNHTLDIEKIVSPEIESILGQEKYAQVNEDITGGLAMSRAMIDGTTSLGQGEASLVIKALVEEINYARNQVSFWIYNEYQQIAEAMGFDRFPKVRWDNAVLRDIILYMTTIANLVDRRMISYETALEELGFDFSNEFNSMQNELPFVLDGTLGIKGSPFQQSKFGPGGTQPTGAPNGTPSSGRPKAQVPKTKQPSTKTNTKTKPAKPKPSQQPNSSPQAASVDARQVIETASQTMTEDEFLEFLCGFVIELNGQ
jgi:hypothetical protein